MSPCLFRSLAGGESGAALTFIRLQTTPCRSPVPKCEIPNWYKLVKTDHFYCQRRNGEKEREKEKKKKSNCSFSSSIFHNCPLKYIPTSQNTLKKPSIFKCMYNNAKICLNMYLMQKNKPFNKISLQMSPCPSTC